MHVRTCKHHSFCLINFQSQIVLCNFAGSGELFSQGELHCSLLYEW